MGAIATEATGALRLSGERASASGDSTLGGRTGSGLLVQMMAPDDPGLLPHWEALVHRGAEPNAFNAPWFLPTALHHYDPNGDTRLFTLWVDAEEGRRRMVALMPLSHESLYGAHPIPHLSNWMHYNAFLGTPMVARGYEQSFWRALLDYADTHAGRALFLHINKMTYGGPLHSALRAVAAAQKRQHACVSMEERAFLQSELGPHAYYEATVRGKKRKELRRQSNRLSELGKIGFTRDNGGEGLEDWISQFLRLEAAGWKGQNRSAIGSHQQSREFFTHLLLAAAAAGALERLTIRFDDRPIAMLVNFLCPPGSFSFKTAFDEAFARFSPGVLLQIENLGILDRADIDWMDSCAAEDHPMIDSLWSGRRCVGRYSIAIGGTARRTAFRAYRFAEDWRARRRSDAAPLGVQEENAE